MDRAIERFRASIETKPTAERKMRASRWPPPYEQFSAAPALDVAGKEAVEAYARTLDC